MRIASRRRLTLAPCWSPAPPGNSGSRFSCLGSSDVEETTQTGHNSSLDNSSLLSSAVRRRKMDEELADKFWADIDYPTPASRVWERPLAQRAGEVSSVCRSDKIEEPSPVSMEGTAASSSNVSATAPAPPHPAASPAFPDD